MAQITDHSSGLISATERRDSLTSSQSASLGSALICLRVTGCGSLVLGLTFVSTFVLVLVFVAVAVRVMVREARGANERRIAKLESV